jgi:hypothetical protein
LALDKLPSVDGYLGLLSFPDLSYHLRIELAKAHFKIFRDSFARDSFGSAAFMWWEWLPGAFFENGPPVCRDQAICKQLIATIKQILYLPSEICQKSALHGINEIGPYIGLDAAPIVDEFISSDVQKTDLVREYAYKVIKGQAQ